MQQITQQQATTDLALMVIEQLAPQELPLFRETSEAFFRNPDAAMRSQVGKDEMLGFGMGEAVTFISPLVIFVAQKVIEFAMEPSKESIQQQFGDRVIRILVKIGLAKKPDVVGSIQPLTPSQLARARQLAIETLHQYNFPKDKRDLVADALIGKLALAAQSGQSKQPIA